MNYTKEEQLTLIQTIQAAFEREEERNRMHALYNNGVIPRTQSGLIKYFVPAYKLDIDEYGCIKNES